MIKDYFEQLNTREQTLVGVTAVFVILYLVYLVIYAPLSSAREEAAKQLAEKQQTLEWMKSVKHHAKDTAKQTLGDTSHLLSLMTEKLSQSPIAKFTYQLQQSSGGNVQLSYDEVPFTPFINWLFTFQSKYAVTIDRLTATKGESDGMVKLTVVLTL